MRKNSKQKIKSYPSHQKLTKTLSNMKGGGAKAIRSGSKSGLDSILPG